MATLQKQGNRITGIWHLASSCQTVWNLGFAASSAYNEGHVPSAFTRRSLTSSIRLVASHFAQCHPPTTPSPSRSTYTTATLRSQTNEKSTASPTPSSNQLLPPRPNSPSWSSCIVSHQLAISTHTMLPCSLTLHRSCSLQQRTSLLATSTR